MHRILQIFKLLFYKNVGIWTKKKLVISFEYYINMESSYTTYLACSLRQHMWDLSRKISSHNVSLACYVSRLLCIGDPHYREVTLVELCWWGSKESHDTNFPLLLNEVFRGWVNYLILWYEFYFGALFTFLRHSFPFCHF